MIKDKKADITAGWLITIILLVIGFGILLIFLYNMQGVTQIDEEVCHQSVIFRATLPSLAQNYLPLKCKTNKVCITTGLFGGKCQEFEGEKGITTARVSSLTQIEKVYAEQILKCWTMMGEGKVSLFSQYIAEQIGIGNVHSSCVICSRIALDKTRLEESKLNLSNINVEGYMMINKVPGKELTYFEYMAGEGGKYAINNNPVKLPNVTQTEKLDPKTNKNLTEVQIKEGVDIGATKVLPIDSEDVLVKETAVLFMQISSPKQIGSAVNIGEMVLGGAAAGFFVAPTKSLGAGRFVGRLCAEGGWICAAIIAAAAVYQQGSVAYNRAVTSGYCGDISIGTDARNGCSVVRTTNYDVAGISEYCAAIESIP